jgi:hypothetical protein
LLKIRGKQIKCKRGPSLALVIGRGRCLLGVVSNPHDANAAVVPRARHPRWLLVTMIVLSVGYAGLFAFAVMGALVSPMVFDSGETPRNWAAFFCFLFFPVLVLMSAAMGWCGFGFRRYRLIPLGFALPVIFGVVFWFSFS